MFNRLSTYFTILPFSSTRNFSDITCFVFFSSAQHSAAQSACTISMKNVNENRYPWEIFKLVSTSMVELESSNSKLTKPRQVHLMNIICNLKKNIALNIWVQCMFLMLLVLLSWTELLPEVRTLIHYCLPFTSARERTTCRSVLWQVICGWSECSSAELRVIWCDVVRVDIISFALTTHMCLKYLDDHKSGSENMCGSRWSVLCAKESSGIFFAIDLGHTFLQLNWTSHE